ncbi:hypothetical protein MNBD_GAMMA24-697 [hydrothermal vent metagenome]|uniref:GIY-YIG domain-containing protein n=1 Tax=hydrothermal vent metagenome TaxID=652676 RepID=A0A3B1BS07_9ZZZZ
MRFSHKDKKNELIRKHSTYALAFPDKLEEAPQSSGVFLLLNENDDVLFVGSNGDIKTKVSSVRNTQAAKDSVAYRWFMTEDAELAGQLASSWINKYSPPNQQALS